MSQSNEMKDVFKMLRQGDKQGLAILYDAYYNKMYGIAFSVSKNRMLSEDAVHNVMCKFMILDVTQFPSEHEFSWLYTVVKNETLMLMRKEKSVLPIEGVSEIGIEDKRIEDFVDLEEFYKIIAPLKDEQKEVVALKILGGYTHKEIAEMLDKPLGTVLWLYNTSIKKLRVLLTSIMSVAIVFLSGFIALVCLFFDGLNQSPTPPGGGSSDTVSPTLSIWGIVLIVIGAIALIVALVIIILKKCKKNTNRKDN